MGSGNAKFLVGLGIGSASVRWFIIFRARRKLKKLKNDVFNALHEIEADAELAVVEAKDKAVKAGAKVAGKVADKATEVKEKLTPNS